MHNNTINIRTFHYEGIFGIFMEAPFLLLDPTYAWVYNIQIYILVIVILIFFIQSLPECLFYMA